MAVVRRQFTAALAGQVATLTPVTGTVGVPNHLTITGATVTFAANAAEIINTLDEYEFILVQKSKTR